ncbi:hypothetical protein DBB29_10130 [Pandoraea cepalis]|uniref:Uncharacterized protein n=1 Tax=Pandoraea cepalis TaxID=2508294 RepID=A0AAW7MHK4_9BURK|nr:hypothetical protein [Pandoraea cepalis]MDN4578470.1 hypothetical protein [Pandoraea cepalis]
MRHATGKTGRRALSWRCLAGRNETRSLRRPLSPSNTRSIAPPCRGCPANARHPQRCTAKRTRPDGRTRSMPRIGIA